MVCWGKSTSISFLVGFFTLIRFWFRAQLFRSCCQPSRSWRDGPYHKDSSRGNNNSYLGVRPIPSRQPCVEQFPGRNRSYPHSCNKGLLQLPFSLALLCSHLTDPVIWPAYQRIWKAPAGMRHFRPTQNSSSQQCSVGHCPSHATCSVQSAPGRWPITIFPSLSDQIIAHQLIYCQCWPLIWSYNNNQTQRWGLETHTMVSLHVFWDQLGPGEGSTRHFGRMYRI